MSDSLWDGRKIRPLNVIDGYSREVLSMETGNSLPALRIIRYLEEIVHRGYPEKIRVDKSRARPLVQGQEKLNLFYSAGRTSTKCLHRAPECNIYKRYIKCLLI